MEATQEDFLRLTRETEELKAKLVKIKDTAEKFKSFIKIPETNEYHWEYDSTIRPWMQKTSTKPSATRLTPRDPTTTS